MKHLSEDGRLLAIKEIFRRYAESKETFLKIAEMCSIKGWPDRKSYLRTLFRLQELYSTQEGMRFAYLADRHAMQVQCYDSLGSIVNRLQQDWSEEEETSLSDARPDYVVISKEIEINRGLLKSSEVDEPLSAVKRDPEYVRAERDFQGRYFELEKGMRRLRGK